MKIRIIKKFILFWTLPYYSYEYKQFSFLDILSLACIMKCYAVNYITCIRRSELFLQQTEENKMGTMPIFRLILSMSLPAMLSMTVQAMYNVVDSYFVAQVSENALTAVSLVFPMQTFLIAVGAGTAVGLNSLIARRLGEKRQGDADSAATHGILLGIFNWILFVAIGIFFSGPFIKSFGAAKEVQSMAIQYMSINCIFSLGVFVEINIEKILQATGNMIYPMIFQMIGAITNIILDPIFIFGLLGVPRMEVAGAAVATVIGQNVAMAVALTVILTKEHKVKIDFKNFKLNKSIIKNIYSVGFPSIVMQAIGSVMVVGINAIIITFTETAVAVFGVYYKLQSFVFMPVFGLMQGVMPVIGYNFGARKHDRLISAVKIGCVISLAIMVIGTAVFLTVPNKLLSIFNASKEMISIGVPALRTICLCFLPAAIGISFSNVFQAVGHGFMSLVISLLRQLVVLLPVAYFLSKLGLYSVWYAFPIAEVFSLIASVLMFLHLNRTVLKKIENG